MRRFLTWLLFAALAFAPACLTPLSDTLIPDSRKRDTVTVTDTTVIWCRYHDPRPECRK